ncbi:MAG: nucleotidyltransferase domain-containing protein [Deltaproteobacteria bacterium]|nr:nucleotidyltransferase domain-containing protein [Deltaproteobacteria bacterium]
MVQLPSDIEGALRSFKAGLLADFGHRVRRVVLFGSVARGAARWDSDVDVLVLLDRLDRGEVSRIVDRAADELTARGVLISPTVMSEDAFAALARRERRLPADITREGIPL